MNNSGIYRWTNKITGKIYIGQAIDLTKRQLDFMHFNSCYAGANINEERKKYPSLEYWNYEVLVKCDPKLLNHYEKKYINEVDTNLLLNTKLVPLEKVNNTKKNKKEKIYTNLYDKAVYGEISYTEYFHQTIENNKSKILSSNLKNILFNERNIFCEEIPEKITTHSCKNFYTKVTAQEITDIEKTHSYAHVYIQIPGDVFHQSSNFNRENCLDFMEYFIDMCGKCSSSSICYYKKKNYIVFEIKYIVFNKLKKLFNI